VCIERRRVSLRADSEEKKRVEGKQGVVQYLTAVDGAVAVGVKLLKQ
jgi:hypothetical protein